MMGGGGLEATEGELEYAIKVARWAAVDTAMGDDEAEDAQIEWAHRWPGPKHPGSDTAGWTLGCMAWVELCRHTRCPPGDVPPPLPAAGGGTTTTTTTTTTNVRLANPLAPPTTPTPGAQMDAVAAPAVMMMDSIPTQLVAMIGEHLPRGNPAGWTMSDMVLGWPSLAAMTLIHLDPVPRLRTVHAAMRWRSGALASGAWPTAVLDDPTARQRPSYGLLAPAAQQPEQLTQWEEQTRAGALWVASEEALAGMATYDRAITRWFLAAGDFCTQRVSENVPPDVLATMGVPRAHPRSALARIREGRLAAPPPSACPVAEVARRLRAAVLVRASSVDAIRARVTGVVRAHERGLSPSTAVPPVTTTSLESYLISVGRLAYSAACMVPGDPERYRTLHPAYRVHDGEACRRLHPQLTSAVSKHLDSAGVDLWTLQGRAHPGPVPGAQRAMCAALLWHNIGDHIRRQEDAVGAEMLHAAYVVSLADLDEGSANERIDREPDTPLLLEGPGGLRCVWRGRTWEAADAGDPWTPVATWFWIARHWAPGCRGVARDADCYLGGVDLHRWISQVGPIFQ